MKFLLILLFFLSGAFFFFTYSTSTEAQNGQNTITSPFPDTILSYFDNVLGSSDVWKPSNTQPQHDITHPDLTAVAAISYDTATEQLLYTKNYGMKLPMASLTKIMTAIIAIENSDLKDEYTVSKSSAETGENAMGLSEGEVLTLEDLLYGMMLPSGNDAAEVIAQGSPFGRENFLYLMNRKAEDLGMLNTRFTNPSGLEGDGFQYSTVTDLLILTRYAMGNETFAKIVSTYEYVIPYSDNHKEYHLYNETNLLTTYPGVKGVKTGFTWEAGMCLVTYLEHGEHKIVGVLLNSQSRRDEMRQLLDYSLERLGLTPPDHS